LHVCFFLCAFTMV